MTLEQMWEQYVRDDLWVGITELELFNAKNAFLTGASAYARAQASVLLLEDEEERYLGLKALADWIAQGLEELDETRDKL